MPQKQHGVKLTLDERQELERFVTRGKKSAREITRARILLLTQDGRRVTEIAQTLGVSRGTIYNTYKRYRQKKARTPLMEGLQEAPRSGRPLKFDSRVEVKATMIACSAPPAGRARWTLQLIADRLVTLGVTDSISHESARQLLKKTASSPGSRNSGA
jgi:putative transposase